MLKLLAIFACFVALGCAYPLAPVWSGFPYYHGSYYYWGAQPYYGYPYQAYPYAHFPHQGVAPGSRLIYYGEFKGHCDGAPDGLYYVDDHSFAYCSNGQKTIQPCAEGSANPPLTHYKHGGYYGVYDFCSVNLVAQGYLGNNIHKEHPIPAVEEKIHTPWDGADEEGQNSHVEEKYP